MIRERTFAEALEHRRSYYSISNDSPVQDEEIVHIIRTAVKYVPSAFNSQTTRVVLLLGDEHQKLWRIVKDQLEERLSEEQYRQSEKKIDTSFSCGYGTILFFEDRSIVEGLQNNSLPIRIISRRGLNKLLPCISWPSGLCSKIKVWVLPCNIITR